MQRGARPRIKFGSRLSQTLEHFVGGWVPLFLYKNLGYRRVIGQKELVKTAVAVEISMATAVISFLKEDKGWTKRVGKNACNP